MKARRAGAAGCSVTACADVRDHVYHLLDGKLTSARVRHIRRHLEACPPCFSRFEFARIMKRILKIRVTAEPCPVALWKKIRGAIACACAESDAPRPPRGGTRLRFGRA